MKTDIINKLAAMLTVSGLSLIAPLTVTASITENSGTINVTAGSVADRADVTYSNSAGSTVSPVSVSTTGAFTGTRVIVNAVGTGGNGRNGITAATQGSLNLTDSAINAVLYGVNASGTATVILNNTNITTGAVNNAHGVNLATSSTLTMTGGTITNSATGAYGVYLNNTSYANLNGTVINTCADGVFITGTSRAELSNLRITTQQESSRGVNVRSGGLLTASNLWISTTGTSQANGLTVQGGTATVSNIYIETHGNASRGIVVETSGTLLLTSATIRTDNTSGIGILVTTGGTMTANHLDIATTGTSAYGMYAQQANSTIFAADVHITTQEPGAVGAWVGFGTNVHLTISGGTITTALATGVALSGVTDNSVTLSDVTVTTTGPDTNAIGVSASGNAGAQTLTISGGTITATQGNAISVNGATGDVALNVTLNDVTVSGSNALQAINGSALNMIVEHSSLTGDLTVSGSSVSVINLNDSVLTGKSTVSDSGIINLSLNNANWNMTGKSKVTTLTSGGGSITIANVQGDDLTVSDGITGQTALHLTLSDGVKDQTEIRVVLDETNSMLGERFTLGSEVSNGMYDYVLENKTDGAWLIYTAPDPVDPTPPVAPIISAEGDAVLNTAASVSGFWFTQLDNLHKRMGELRYNKSANGDVLDNVWVRAYGQQINANIGITSVKGFSETQYGIDLGTDKAWTLDKNNTVYTGVFAGYGGADRDFHTSYQGSIDSGYGGVYGTWLNKDGWYADAVAKGQYFRNDFNGVDKASYDSIGVGLSLELGKTFEFKQGWFAEPSVQLSYLHLMNDNYTTRDGMGVTLSDADVLHIYGGARFGRNIKLTNSGQLQPYIKAGGLGQISSGNQVTVSGDHWRPNLDGARAVVGAGVVWQLDADSQLHLDYEASFGEKYDKPWGVNFGYRYQF